jgi:recombinational DNA repair ATPase RecF
MVLSRMVPDYHDAGGRHTLSLESPSIASRNPPIVPADTALDVWRRQMAAIASRSMAERLEEWDGLNRAVADMERAWIRRRHPHYTDRQVFLATVRHRYGDDLVRGAWPDESLVDW